MLRECYAGELALEPRSGPSRAGFALQRHKSLVASAAVIISLSENCM